MIIFNSRNNCFHLDFCVFYKEKKKLIDSKLFVETLTWHLFIMLIEPYNTNVIFFVKFLSLIKK